MMDKPEGVNFDTTPPLQVVQYDNMISKFVPGYEAIFQISLAHLKTVLNNNAQILIVGAGTGKELITFGQDNAGWSLTGIDPSADMLTIARQKITQYNLDKQITLHQGLIEELPASNKYDAATAILIMHFLADNGAKLALLKNIASRLKTGAPLILVDIYGDTESVKNFGPTWIKYGHQMGLPLEIMQNLEKTHANFHPITETRTLELLQQAGFENIRRFYTALIYSGWISTTNHS